MCQLSEARAAADIGYVAILRLTLGALFLIGGACVGGEPTACDGFADRKLAISAQEYRACAGEIMDALDAVERPLRAFVAGKASKEDRDACGTAYQQLRLRIRRTGLEDDYVMRPGVALERWSSGNVSAFNSAASTASVQYGAVLVHPNADNFAQGVRAHEEARRQYRAFR